VARIETSAMTSGGHFFGSPSYMAPEQILGGDVTGRVDLFSFAIVAYETVTARRPFEGEGISSIVYRVVHCPAPTPRTFRDDLPDYYDAVFRKALAKDPAHRFPTASALVAALYGNDLEALLLSSAAIAEASPEMSRDNARPPAEVETHALKTLPPSRGSKPWLVGASMVLGVGLVVAVPRVKAPEALPPAPAAVPLRIETEPVGAAVWVDGANLGQSPVYSGLLKPGRHEVRVTQEGYAPAQLTLDIEPGMAPLRFQMTPLATLPSAVAEPPAEPAARVALHTAAAASTVTQRMRPSPSPLPGAVHDLERDPTIVKPQRKEGRNPDYPEAAQRLRFGGEVSGDMVVTESGETTDIRVLDGAGEVLDRAAVDAVRTWRFTPARKDGRPVRVRMRFHQRFDPTI
jgi:TonB family protein